MDNKVKVIPKDLKAFNLGACIFTFIWGIRYRAWITLIAIPLILIQLPLGLNWLLFCAFQLYCGFKGNEWAYQVEWWKKPQDFKRTQMAWAVSAMIVTVIVPFITALFLVRFLKKSPDNPIEFVRNAQCVTAYNRLQKGVNSIPVASTSQDMAKQFSRKYRNVQLDDSKVIFTTGQDKTKAYFIMFNKMDEGAGCDVDKNCFVTSSYELPEVMVAPFEPCVFYIDNQKNIMPDDSTEKALQKGNNIFKYL